MYLFFLEQQTTGKKKKKIKKKCACAWFRRTWRAIKRIFTCSQNNEVVPFTQSDPQSSPYEQSHLRVYKPGIVDSADHLPGWCNWEKMALKDPSAVQPAAPEEPAHWFFRVLCTALILWLNFIMIHHHFLFIFILFSHL